MSRDVFRAETLAKLRRRLANLERSYGRPRHSSKVVPTGIDPLDTFLPNHGLPRGSLVEWLTPEAGAGAGTLAFLLTGKILASTPGAFLVLGGNRQLYPPAVSRLGIDLDRMIVVRPPKEGDAAWALEQALRCPGVAVAAGWFGHLDDLSFRRLQLAAESEDGLGLLLRPARFRQAPSWAHFRLLVEPVTSGHSEQASGPSDGSARPGTSPFASLQDRPPPSRGRCLRVELLHSQGGFRGGMVDLEIDDETGDVHSLSRLASPAPSQQAAEA